MLVRGAKTADDLHLSGDRPEAAVATIAVEVDAQLIVAGNGTAEEKLLRTEAVAEVGREATSAARMWMIKTRLLAFGVVDPEVDIAIVCVPCDDDTEVGGQVGNETWIHATEIKLTTAGGDDCVELTQGDQADVGKSRIPWRRHYIPEQIDSALKIFQGHTRQGEVATTLRILTADSQDLFEKRASKLGLSRVHQAVGEDAKESGILEL